VFGARGATTALSRATAILAGLFMLTSLSLTYVGTHRAASSGSLLDQLSSKPAPTSAPAPAVPAPGAAPATGEGQSSAGGAPTAPTTAPAAPAAATPPAGGASSGSPPADKPNK
jgi:preprotein translocase subunit SecG